VIGNAGKVMQITTGEETDHDRRGNTEILSVARRTRVTRRVALQVIRAIRERFYGKLTQ
jgi:hypothetical protein